jgi:4-hydroxybenzoate polyprenyltransferase/phosphoserine phosphatase
MHTDPATTIAVQGDAVPLCVDLDGTVLRTDCLWESLFCALQQDPLVAVKAIGWLAAGGRAGLKRELAARVRLAVDTLPYNMEVVEFLKKEKQRGRRLVLVTASDEEIARSINNHLNIFDEVHGSQRGRNLKGRSKAEFLVNQYGKNGFDYVGDSAADLPVWHEARTDYLVRPSDSVKAATKVSHVIVLDRTADPLVARLFRALRCHQWVKNLLLFIPLMASHKWNILDTWLRLGLFFAAFSLAASSVYLFNDLIDLESDRRNFRKRWRPLASGRLPLVWGAVLCAGCFSVSMVIAVILGWIPFALLAAYTASTVWYSLYLKRVPMLDVLVLASFYTFRLAGGGVVAHVEPSPWLLALALFLFLSLAMAKRYSELLNRKLEGGEVNQSRGYRLEDLPQLNIMGASSGYVAVLVLALYINSDQIVRFYERPVIFWAVCPLMLYWISRLWLLAHRGQMNEDPIVFALKDRVSYVLGALGVLVVLLAGPK